MHADLKSIPSQRFTGAATGIEIIQDPHTIQKLYNNLVKSAKEEIMLFLPTTSSFLREERIGIIQSLHDAARDNVRVKVITPADKKAEPRMQSLFENMEGLELRCIRQGREAQMSVDARTKILIVDKKEYLVVELKDDSKETFVDAVRLAVYSATESTVNSYLTLFESLWEQAKLYEQLETHDKMQQEFINVAAHELRTPIQPLLALIDILDLNSQDDEEEKEVRGLTRRDTRLIARNILRLQRLSQAILDSTRIEGNTLRLNKEKLDLNEEVSNAITDARAAVKRHDLEISFKRTGEPIVVEADRIRIFEVVSNLVGNAIKFTTSGKIDLKLERIDSFAVVSVRDTGTGISPEVFPKLFTKFGIGSGTTSGSGLGLYISRAIIEAHGGRMWAENNHDGKGATFKFSLPTCD